MAPYDVWPYAVTPHRHDWPGGRAGRALEDRDRQQLYLHMRLTAEALEWGR